MDKHWNQYCTMSIVHFMAFPECASGEGPILETVTRIAEDPFFDAVELSWIKDPDVRADVKRVLKANDMKIGYGAHPPLLSQGLNLNSLVEEERMRAVDQLNRCIDEAAELGAESVVFLSGKDPGDTDRPAAMDALVRSIRAAARYAGDRGLALTCELFDRDVDKKCLIGPTELAVELSATIRQDFPSFGLLHDLGHQPLMFEESEPALTKLRDHLVHIHVGNCVLDPEVPSYGDTHPRFGWPGGCNDVDELKGFLRALFKVGYLAHDGEDRPWVGFEVKPQSDAETSEQVILDTQRVWEQAWSEL